MGLRTEPDRLSPAPECASHGYLAGRCPFLRWHPAPSSRRLSENGYFPQSLRLEKRPLEERLTAGEDTSQDPSYTQSAKNDPSQNLTDIFSGLTEENPFAVQEDHATSEDEIRFGINFETNSKEKVYLGSGPLKDGFGLQFDEAIVAAYVAGITFDFTFGVELERDIVTAPPIFSEVIAAATGFSPIPTML
jgi:hypothetical protein